MALPHGGLVELGVGVRQGSAVAAGTAHGEGRAGPPAEHLARQGVQGARQARLGARRVRVRDHVGEPGVVSCVRPCERRLQRAQRRRAGPRGGQEAGVSRGLRLRRRAVCEEVVVASRSVVVALVVCGGDGEGTGRRERRPGSEGLPGPGEGTRDTDPRDDAQRQGYLVAAAGRARYEGQRDTVEVRDPQRGLRRPRGREVRGCGDADPAVKLGRETMRDAENERDKL